VPELIYTTRAIKKNTIDQNLGQVIMLGDKLGEGGEGSVWSVIGHQQVAKIYNAQTATQIQEKKLELMINNPPQDDMAIRYNHISIAWPDALLFQGTTFAGFLMPCLKDSFKILDIYNPKVRKVKCPGFNWKYLVHTALNLSVAVQAIHSKNYVIGDLNEGNIMVNPQALVSLIDTDSFQVKDNVGLVYPCPVGKEEFTPPELHGRQFNQVTRLPYHDYFGLGVLIFLLLMEGNHPFTGRMKLENPSADPDNIYCLKTGKFPYAPNRVCDPRPTAPTFKLLPKTIRSLFLRCFMDGYKQPSTRPTPAEWVKVLESAEEDLLECRRDPSHWYSNHLHDCPWCQPARPLINSVAPSIQQNTTHPRQSYPANNPTPLITHGNPNSTPLKTGSVKPFFSGFQSINKPSPKRKTKLISYPVKITFQMWEKSIQKGITWGIPVGLCMAGLIVVLFNYPIQTSQITTSCICLGFLGLGTWLIMFKLKRILDRTITWIVKILGLVIVIAISAFLWPGLNKVIYYFLSSKTTLPGWLVLVGLLLGSGGGAAISSFILFRRNHRPVMAYLCALLVLVPPLVILLAVGAFNSSFQIHP
jgi:serine/threonine protein kinase